MSVEIIGCACLISTVHLEFATYMTVCQFPNHLPSSGRLQQFLKCSDPSFNINVQMQAGADDCGLFSIAFATALCAEKDPHKCSFQQSEMRSHLKLCFERGELAMFPASKPRRCASSIKSRKNVEVYCTCRLPWDRNTSLFGNLAQCAKCRDWFHQTYLLMLSSTTLSFGSAHLAQCCSSYLVLHCVL